MTNIIFWVYMVVSLLFVVFSYGFVDANLSLSTHPVWNEAQDTLTTFVRQPRWVGGVVFAVFLVAYTALYAALLRRSREFSFGFVRNLVVAVSLILALSYSALSYDIFNYITTAKVAFHYQENPYIVMPIDIANEPNLAFTRAANKVALYGPTWILLSGIPHVMSMGNIWLSLVVFKVFVVLFLWMMCALLWRLTGSLQPVVFFAFNPLVLMEIAVSGHNDIVMMTGIVAAYSMFYMQKNAASWKLWGLFALGVAVKGAIAPLGIFLWKKVSFQAVIVWSFWIMMSVFFVLAPLREELYPWYAVWFLPFAAVLLSQKRVFEVGLSLALSIGLELRHIPYIVMGYYEGPGPLLRMLCTIVPVMMYLLYYSWFLKQRGRI
jgi:hypothetical protein